jgi:large subunit ribosomal protein L24
MKIRTGDTVLIISGKDREKTGKVSEVFPKNNKIIVEGLNIVKKHTKPRREGEKGQVVQVSRPIDVSNVKLICSKCKKPTRIGYRILGKNKTRVCNKCKQEI